MLVDSVILENTLALGGTWILKNSKSDTFKVKKAQILKLKARTDISVFTHISQEDR
jgi:hypothetical protein